MLRKQGRRLQANEHSVYGADPQVRSQHFRDKLAMAIAEVPRHVQLLEDLFQNLELDSQIARDLGDALTTELVRAQVAADRQAAQLVTSDQTSNDEATQDQEPDWEMIGRLAQGLAQAKQENEQRW